MGTDLVEKEGEAIASIAPQKDQQSLHSEGFPVFHPAAERSCLETQARVVKTVGSGAPQIG